MIEEKKSRGVHNIVLEGRKSLSVSGVNDVDSFDEKQVSMFTDMGLLNIKGADLHINQFNTATGELNLSGTIDQVYYKDEEKRTASGVFAKLFH